MTATKTVPAAACLFKVGPLTFGRLAANSGDTRTVPVELRARSGQPIDHWYWGRVVHDMGGFKSAAPSIPLDYCHNDNEVIGFLNRFQPTGDGLDCGGQMVIVRDDDRASEVLAKSQAGAVPSVDLFR